MARLHLCMLGPPQILLDGQPVTAFESDKVRALLVYLAAEADLPHSRERLAGLFWPDLPEPRARQNLSQALFNLRHAVNDYTIFPSFLRITRDSIQFNRDSDHWLDVAAFVACLATGAIDTARLEAAIALYRGPFLADCTLAGTVAYEEWVLLWRERCHRLTVDALLHLVASCEAEGQAEQALLAARRLVELEPWHEEAHRCLMRLLARMGRRSEALAQYETCRRLLAEELHVGPSVETIQMYEQIRDGRVVAGKPAQKAQP